MPLGAPAINTPNALDLRALQTAVANTRSRIEKIEAALNSGTGVSSSSAGGTLSLANLLQRIATLQQQLNALQAQVDALGGAVDLGALIAALPFSSGVDPDWFIAAEVGGVAMRVTAADIAALGGGGGGGAKKHYKLPVSDGDIANPQIVFFEGDIVTSIEDTFA